MAFTYHPPERTPTSGFPRVHAMTSALGQAAVQSTADRPLRGRSVARQVRSYDTPRPEDPRVLPELCGSSSDAWMRTACGLTSATMRFVTILLASALTFGCSKGRSQEPMSALLITLDTTRADALG